MGLKLIGETVTAGRRPRLSTRCDRFLAIPAKQQSYTW